MKRSSARRGPSCGVLHDRESLFFASSSTPTQRNADCTHHSYPGAPTRRVRQTPTSFSNELATEYVCLAFWPVIARFYAGSACTRTRSALFRGHHHALTAL